jgi:hypothetical protein
VTYSRELTDGYHCPSLLRDSRNFAENRIFYKENNDRLVIVLGRKVAKKVFVAGALFSIASAIASLLAIGLVKQRWDIAAPVAASCVGIAILVQGLAFWWVK